MNITLLHSSKFDFEDPKTLKKIAGIKLHYIFNDDLDPVIVDNNERGYQVAEAVISTENELQIEKVPGVYEGKFLTRVNAKGQPIQKLVGIKYISTVPELFITVPNTKKAV